MHAKTNHRREKNGLLYCRISFKRVLFPLLFCTCGLTLILVLLIEDNNSEIAQYIVTSKRNFIHVTNNQTATLFSKKQESSTESVFPLQFSQWVEDIDTSNTKCGVFKCAFHSMTNQQLIVDNQRHDDNSKRYGYLLSQEKPGYDSDMADESWDMAKELSEKFSIRQLMLAPPNAMNLTRTFAMKLNANVLSATRGSHALPRFTAIATQKLIVQPLQLVPEGSFFVGCAKVKYDEALDELKEYESNTNQTLLSSSELQRFEDQLRHDFSATMAMLNSNEGSCLRDDFQVFVDPNTGSIYHFDIDRCFQGEELISDFSECHSQLVRYINNLLEIRGGSKLVNVVKPEILQPGKNKNYRTTTIPGRRHVPKDSSD